MKRSENPGQRLWGVSMAFPAETAIIIKTIFLSVQGMWHIKHMSQKHTESPLKSNQFINDMQPSIFFCDVTNVPLFESFQRTSILTYNGFLLLLAFTNTAKTKNKPIAIYFFLLLSFDELGEGKRERNISHRQQVHLISVLVLL